MDVRQEGAAGGPGIAADRADALAYRADIDGLRAIAVLAVALFHAEIPGFSGGFVGVDIFFVISGFLITRIIAAEAAAGRFSYLRFYERRARRLAPALFVVVAAVAVFTLLYRSPRDADIFGESVSLFAVFAANFFFYNQLDYFGDPAVFYPLLHMWSLAVEEQFYLILPPLLLLFWRFGRGGALLALGALAAASFAAALIAMSHDPQLAFFHTPFRMWQLLAGGLLALAPPPRWSAGTRNALGLIGLALALAPVALYDKTTLFPGLAAAPPTLGAVLVIAAGLGRAAGPKASAPSPSSTRLGLGPSPDQRSPAGADPAPAAENGPMGGIAARLLSAPPLVFIGLCSYSFYLWHWPALTAARFLSPGPMESPLSIPSALMVLAAAFGLSALTWAYVERPFRRPGGVLSGRGVAIGVASCVAALLLLGWVLQETRGLPARFPSLAPMFTEDARRYGLAPQDCARATRLVPEALRGEIDPGFCKAHDAGPDRPVALLWGDSHAWALAPGVARWAEAADVSLFVAWSATCPPLLGVDRPVQTRFHDCRRHNAAALRLAPALGVDQLILAAQWSRYHRRVNLTARLGETVAAARAAGAAPVLIGETPPAGVHAPTALFRAEMVGAPPGALPEDRAEALAPIAGSVADLEAAARAAAIPLWSPAPAICPRGGCVFQADDKAPLYADSHHLNRIGARRLGAALAEILGPHDNQGADPG
ncbi:MAG: acyltransferase family protein [Pseudomonadota bacterium]